MAYVFKDFEIPAWLLEKIKEDTPEGKSYEYTLRKLLREYYKTHSLDRGEQNVLYRKSDERADI